LDQVDPKVFDIIGMSKDDVRNIIKSNSDVTDYAVLKDKIDRDEALLLKSRLSSYGDLKLTNLSAFLHRPFISHVLGYVGKVSQEEVQTKPSLLVLV